MAHSTSGPLRLVVPEGSPDLRARVAVPPALTVVAGPGGSGKTASPPLRINILHQEREDAHIIKIEYRRRHKC
jgi:type II secretory ATPase GspE/PulE/Tfp pilus assembly ATPase PilB-like protein